MIKKRTHAAVKRSIRDIAMHKEPSMEESVRRLQEKKRDRKRKKIPRTYILHKYMRQVIIFFQRRRVAAKLLLIPLLGFFIFIVSLLFVGASTVVEIVPTTISAQYQDEVFDAVLYNDNVEKSDNVLTYKIVRFDMTKFQDIDTQGNKMVKSKASGSITIYNTLSGKPQILIKNTRFKSKSGKIYRIHKEVSVPGMRNGIPGTMDVMVYAENIGEEYNLNNGKLTIPGLQKYKKLHDKIYAEVHSSIQGGSNGKKGIIDSSQKRIAIEWLKDQIIKNAYEKVHEKVDNAYIYFKNGLSVDFTNLSEKQIGSMARLTQNAQISVIVFDKERLARKIATGRDGNPGEGNPKIVSGDTLQLSINKSDLQDPHRDHIRFIVNGSAEIAWHVKKDSLREALLGQKRNQSKRILSQYASIDKAKVIYRPFWSRKFPQDHDKIIIHIKE